MSKFEVTRSVQIDASPEKALAVITDLRRWEAWTPWRDLDANVKYTYSGPESGVGAKCAWSGGEDAGEGWMEITEVAADHIDMMFSFERPWTSKNDVRIALTPAAGGTMLTWTMTGKPMNLLSRMVASALRIDQHLGAYAESGLARLKEDLERA